MPMLVLQSIGITLLACGVLYAVYLLLYKKQAVEVSTPVKAEDIRSIADYDMAKAIAIKEWKGQVSEQMIRTHDYRKYFHWGRIKTLMEQYFDKVEDVSTSGAASLTKSNNTEDLGQSSIYKLWKNGEYIFFIARVYSSDITNYIPIKEFRMEQGGIKVKKTDGKKTWIGVEIPVVSGFVVIHQSSAGILKLKSIKELAQSCLIEQKPPEEMRDEPVIGKIVSGQWGLTVNHIPCSNYSKYDTPQFYQNYPPMKLTVNGQEYNNVSIDKILEIIEIGVENQMNTLLVGDPGTGKSKIMQVLMAKFGKSRKYSVYDIETAVCKLLFNPKHSGVMSHFMSSKAKNATFIDDIGSLLLKSNNDSLLQGTFKSLLNGNLWETLSTAFIMSFDGDVKLLNSAVSRNGRLSIIVHLGHMDVTFALQWVKHWQGNNKNENLVFNTTRLHATLEKPTKLSPHGMISLDEIYACIDNNTILNIINRLKDRFNDALDKVKILKSGKQKEEPKKDTKKDLVELSEEELALK